MDLTDRSALIVGAGKVAERKARGLVRAGVRQLTVVAPVLQATFPQGTILLSERYHPEHLDQVDLVFAATDSPDVNAQVVRDARARRIWVNRADADEQHGGDFVLPAQHHAGSVSLAVATGSASLSAYVRDQLIRAWDTRWTLMAEAMQSIRPLVRDDSGLSPDQRRQIFKTLASDQAMSILDVGGREALIQWIRDQYPQLADA